MWIYVLLSIAFAVIIAPVGLVCVLGVVFLLPVLVVVFGVSVASRVLFCRLQLFGTFEDHPLEVLGLIFC